MKKVFTVVLSAMMTVMMFFVPVQAEEKEYKVRLYGTITDAGQVVSKAEIDYGDNVRPKADLETFTVKTQSIIQFGKKKNQPYYVDAHGVSSPIERKIVKTETRAGKVILYFDLSNGGTLTWLSEGRNYPGQLQYTFTQKKDISLTAPDGRELDPIKAGTKYSLNEKGVIDEETKKFVSVTGKDINYQYHKGINDTLIVWFHGNGEGDFEKEVSGNKKEYQLTNNNVAQMLANRGTVAWSSKEAQRIYGNAHVIAFQAPSTWYYAQKEHLLEKAYKEIQEVIKKNKINPAKLIVSGCSAGGYMTTRMLIKYPSLFKAAMINCPALDVASQRGGETPTDKELESLRKSPTAIWLVQGETDSSVATKDCSQRMFEILTKGRKLKTTKADQKYNSDFVTKETEDQKYLWTLYETVAVNGANKIKVEEDYDLDNKKETVYYSDHWTWIFTLNNNPYNSKTVHIMNWAASHLNKEETNPQTAVKPKLLNISNNPYIKKSGKAVIIKINSELKSFTKLLVDGKETSKNNYTLASGSTIITLKAEYLDQLKSGKHKVEVITKDGKVTVTITIKDVVKTDRRRGADTADRTSITGIVVLMIISIIGLVILRKKID